MLNDRPEDNQRMRLCSYRDGRVGERLAVIDGDWALPAGDLLPDGPRTMAELIARGDRALAVLRAATDPERVRRDGRPLTDLDLLAPLPRPGKVVAIGRNYRDHAAEEGLEPPPAPLIFAKFASSVVGPGADVRWDPWLTSQVDYEAELAVIVGRRARRVALGDALEYVFGYTCLNDVSARDLQFGDGQWTRGKSLDTFCPMGPLVVTAEELGDASGLAIRCLVNGEERQSARTSDLFYGVAAIVSHCSQAFTLEPGDVIATGTPGGVGAFRKPPVWLADGDEVVVEIERIGRLVNRFRTELAS
jgi:2-keto-4-pentenoate hydratase/2-oxohepta-3-ene-1,7-dioic acid hydratase in catechol pathway